MFLFGMGYKGDLTNGENVEALQLQGYTLSRRTTTT